MYVHYGSKQLFEHINSAHSPLLDTTMYYATMMGEAYVIVGVLLGLMLVKRFRNVTYLLYAVVCNVVPMLLQQGLKSYFDRPRPLNFFSTAPWLHRLDHWPELYGRSFPSGHSEGAFAFFCFLSLLLPVRYRSIGLVFFILALSVCYSRVYLTAHFFEDTYAGSVIGVTVCTICFMAMQSFMKNKNGFLPTTV
jgi:undecaprenyl-diphosphatase